MHTRDFIPAHRSLLFERMLGSLRLGWAGVSTVALVGFLLLGCASSSGRKSAAPPRDRDTLVPEETQRESEQMYGAQEGFGDQLNMTPSEQAGAAHDAAVDRARDPGRESRKKK